jgi:hypothetical protein
MAERWVLRMNGREEVVIASGDTPLLYVLRNDSASMAPNSAVVWHNAVQWVHVPF